MLELNNVETIFLIKVILTMLSTKLILLDLKAPCIARLLSSNPDNVNSQYKSLRDWNKSRREHDIIHRPPDLHPDHYPWVNLYEKKSDLTQDSTLNGKQEDNNQIDYVGYNKLWNMIL